MNTGFFSQYSFKKVSVLMPGCRRFSSVSSAIARLAARSSSDILGLSVACALALVSPMQCLNGESSSNCRTVTTARLQVQVHVGLWSVLLVSCFGPNRWVLGSISSLNAQHPTSPKPQYPIPNEPKIPIPNTHYLFLTL